jgi:transcription elongation factor GreA
MLDKEIYLTKQGFTKIEEELDHLKSVKRPELIERLQETKGGSDWMDNTEYVSIQDELAFIDGRIQELEYILQKAELIEPGEAGSVVRVGNTAIIRANGSDLERYTIVGSAEADPAQGLISNESPLGQALLNRKVGDTVTVETPGGEIHYHIVAVT